MATKKAKKPKGKSVRSKKNKVVPLRGKDKPASRGDNSGINQPLVELFERAELLKEQIKELNKEVAECRTMAKEEHGVSKWNFNHELAMRKFDAGKRVELERGSIEVKEQLGFDFAALSAAPLEEDGEGDESADAAELAAQEA